MIAQKGMGGEAASGLAVANDRDAIGDVLCLGIGIFHGLAAVQGEGYKD